MAKQAVTVNRTPRSLEQKLAALADFEAKVNSTEDVAKKHGVSTATLYNWQKLRKEGALMEPQAPGKAPTVRKKWDPEIKARIVAEYKRGALPASELADRFGCTTHQIYHWSSVESVSLAKAKPGSIAAQVTATNKSQQTITFESPSGDSLEVAVLKRRNQKLQRISRALVELLMEDL